MRTTKIGQCLDGGELRPLCAKGRAEPKTDKLIKNRFLLIRKRQSLTLARMPWLSFSSSGELYFFKNCTYLQSLVREIPKTSMGHLF